MAKYHPLGDNPFADILDPADNPFSDISDVPPITKSIGETALDVVKQIPSGLIAGTEAIATFPAQAARLGGELTGSKPTEPAASSIEQRLRSFVPGLTTPDASAVPLTDLTKQGRAGIAPYLPEPTTKLGQFTRTGTEFIPGAVAGRGTLSAPRAVGVGATAGLTSELGGQLTEGTAAEPVFRVLGGLVGGVGATRQAERAAAKAAVPTIKQSEARAGQLFDEFRNSGLSYSPTVAPQFSTAIKTELHNRGLTDSSAVAGGTWNAVTKALESNPARTPQDFHSLYQELGHIASGAGANKGERLAANIAQERLLQFMEATPQGALTGNVNAPAQAVEALREANQIWAAAQRAKNVSGRITKAEQVASGQYSGLGLENELRRRMGVLGLPPEASAGRPAARGFTEGERRAFEQFGQGTPLQNLRRYATGALSGRGGIGVGGLFLGGGGLAGYLGADPVVSGAIGAGAPALGVTLAMLGNRSARNRARELEQMLLSRSPLANIPQPASAGTALRQQAATTLIPTLGTLGEQEGYELHPNEGYPYYAPRGGP